MKYETLEKAKAAAAEMFPGHIVHVNQTANPMVYLVMAGFTSLEFKFTSCVILKTSTGYKVETWQA